MPTPQEVQQQQQVQGAQQGVAPMDFDPDVIMKEVVMKDMANQIKEQELTQKEMQLMQMNDQIQQAQAQQVQTEQAQAQEQAVPIAPMQGQPIPQSTPPQQQQQSDLSEQTMQNLQPGQKVTVTKKIQMGPQGPVEVGRSENISGSGA